MTDARRRSTSTRAEHGNKPPFELAASAGSSGKDKLDLDDAVQLRLHGRHHRRQLRQPGRQPAGEFVGHHLRRQHPVLAWNFAFSDKQGRAVHVDSRGIMEALRKVYGAEGLAHELTGATAAPNGSKP